MAGGWDASVPAHPRCHWWAAGWEVGWWLREPRAGTSALAGELCRMRLGSEDELCPEGTMALEVPGEFERAA